MRYLTPKILWISLFFSTFVICFDCLSYGASLDDFYQTLLKKDRFMYNGSLSYFRMEDKGIHGNASFDKIESTPVFLSLDNLFIFSPLDSLEMSVGYNQIFSSSYRRSIYAPGGDPSGIYNFDLTYFQDYYYGLRLRDEPLEIYLNVLEKRQKAKWDYASYPSAPAYFTHIRTHFEDIKTGVRYISGNEPSQTKSNLSKLKQPLLDNGQINIEAELGYKNGKLKRESSQYYLGDLYNYYYYHNLRPHFIPRISLRYGLSNTLEVTTGLHYKTPLEYEYEYKLYYPDLTSKFITGTYKLKNDLYIPFSIKSRPENNFEILFSLDYHFINQKLDYREKARDDTTTNYASRKLTYHNVKPTIKFTLLCDKDESIQEDEFSSLTKNLLSRGQWLIEFLCQKDITRLRKNPENGPQNIIDPYNVFLYPLDYFVGGSEYAVAFSGDYSSFATNVQPQNYYTLQAAFTYGITDNFNAGLKTGYYSGSHLHQFTLSDMKERFYKFRPHYFLDFLSNWRMTRNSLFSFNSHFVPRYKTYLDYEGDPKEYKSRNLYFEIELALKVLF